ncbi:MAG: phospholipid carrier-dependent glycosyltransferase [Thermoleophilia bacterium]
MAFRLSAPASVAIIVAAICVVVISAAVRLYELERPSVFVFDELYYARDAHTILDGYLGPNPAYPWEPGKEASWAHPEYGKLAIAVGEAIFGYTAFGWRIMATLAGTLLIALIYPLGRRLGLPPGWALLGLILAASDFLGIVQSRLAMLDIFVAFWSLVCVYLALHYVQSGQRRRWLTLCGLAGGLALGTKWSGALALAAAAAIIVVYRRRPWRGPLITVARQALYDVVWPLVALVILPAALYVASYSVYFSKGRHSLAQWVQLQREMWWFNENLHTANAAASHAYSWIFDYQAIWYVDKQMNGSVHRIIAMGNPLLWAVALPALVALAVLACVHHQRQLLLVPLIVALLYLPWLATTRTSYLYYMTPVAPFLALAVALLARELSTGQRPRLWLAALCYAITATVVALFSYPIARAAAWLCWRLPAHVSLDLARVVVALAVTIVAAGFLTSLQRRNRRRLWPYLSWAYAGAVSGVCLACLPILTDLSISATYFHHLLWLGNLI